MYLGVDEAGKGPVLGPMVAAAVLADPASLPADVDDSKRLSSTRREAIDAAVREAESVAVGVATVEPAAIDRPDTDMNTLTVRGQAQALRLALRAADPDGTGLDEPVRVVADAGDTSEERFAGRLGRFVREPDPAAGHLVASAAEAPRAETDVDSPVPDIAVEAAHGADERDPVVGAASVVAKVARDARMAAIDDAYPAYDGLGSGYPGDPATRAFLRAYVTDHGDLPDCARRSWSTCDDVLAAAAQSELDEF
ncbi:ribonuclease HII [Halorubrum sp. CBA1125]|uniref:ribonuclease HII n=1 Tax=Halorubrum sp. CBA1125 TaxID=2668072 RepID=UPI00135DE44E|nr:ribonuclease HII [Halorubrum sp. CBA1125]MUW15040.1 ribonuclease HII [Halorubrum sp. CBA1125]